MVEIPDKVLTPNESEETQTPQGTAGEITPKPVETPFEAKGQPAPDVDYKIKFSESAREVQRLLNEDKLNKARLAELDAKLAKEASKVPSEDDLFIKYPDWDMFTDAEKAIYRKVETQERKLAEIEEEKEWEKDFSKAKKKLPQLAEREEEFKEYCKKYPRTIDAETLAKSFLYEEGKETPKRKGLETPTSGPKEGITSEFTWEDVDRIRKTDEKLFQKLINEGRIDTRKIKK